MTAAGKYRPFTKLEKFAPNYDCRHICRQHSITIQANFQLAFMRRSYEIENCVPYKMYGIPSNPSFHARRPRLESHKDRTCSPRLVDAGMLTTGSPSASRHCPYPPAPRPHTQIRDALVFLAGSSVTSGSAVVVVVRLLTSHRLTHDCYLRKEIHPKKLLTNLPRRRVPGEELSRTNALMRRLASDRVCNPWRQTCEEEKSHSSWSYGEGNERWFLGMLRPAKRIYEARVRIARNQGCNRDARRYRLFTVKCAPLKAVLKIWFSPVFSYNPIICKIHAARTKREIPKKTGRIAASSGAIPDCESLELNRPGIEPSLPCCEASSQTAQSPIDSYEFAKVCQLAELRLPAILLLADLDHQGSIAFPFPDQLHLQNYMLPRDRESREHVNHSYYSDHLVARACPHTLTSRSLIARSTSPRSSNAKHIAYTLNSNRRETTDSQRRRSSSETDLLTNSQCDNRAEHLPRREAPGREPAATLPLSYEDRAKSSTRAVG
ncbi:hypothetical protein PR048_000281 [Dryococelus australis]|uniref:Uncharacterized protein n=1 Tax=Dryococelus australis TaxID=614101 RepID=A0ABQ9IE72_9NEOP|nr:hypothetical protein PR048_000281 [Dryococelus australis]